MMFIPKIVDSQFLVRIILNQAGPEEREFFESWLAESDEHKEEFGNFILLWDKMGKARIPEIPNPFEQFDKIKEKLNSRNKPSLSIKTSEIEHPVIRQMPLNTHKTKMDSRKRANSFSWFLRIAASLLIFISFYFLKNNLISPPVVVEKPQSNIIYEIVTNKGERSTIPLADGTVIYLNSGSRLKYPRVFAGNERRVELSGEAYFSVTSNKEKPFKVVTGNTITEVVGTEFNVRYRLNNLNVVVSKGIVKTFQEKSNDFVKLTQGDMLSFTPERGFSKPRRVNLREYLAWRENKMSFKKAPLIEVMNEIEMYYNVNVIFDNKGSKTKKLTGLFDADSLDHILGMISISMDVEIERKGNTIKVH